MTKRTHGWILTVVLIAALLTSAYVIVDRNHQGDTATETPSGFMH